MTCMCSVDIYWPTPTILLVIGHMTLIREHTVLISDPIAVQILTHNPSLSSVSRYPVALEFPRAGARHHQPDLPHAPTPRAFARISSLLHRHPPSFRYSTYLVYYSTLEVRISPVSSVQINYTLDYFVSSSCLVPRILF